VVANEMRARDLVTGGSLPLPPTLIFTTDPYLTEEQVNDCKIVSLSSAQKSDVDALIVADEGIFPAVTRQLESFARRGVLILPGSADWIVPQDLRGMSALDTAWHTEQFVNYAARCGLRGHYLEFGTFWGASFFRNYYRYRHWTDGKFYAFDSFEGLSAPEARETEYTAGDFVEGAYTCNEESFRATAALVGMPEERLIVVPGFFNKTLVGSDPRRYGLDDRSVSVCYIDCDLLDPTADVLNFVSPALQDGALVYFDDWRLCRASDAVGERAAALKWLERNPSFELIELYRTAWQHQWFIFQRKTR